MLNNFLRDCIAYASAVQFDSHATARDSDSESAGHTPKDVLDKDAGDKLPQQKRLRTDGAPGLIRSDSGSSGGNRGSASSVPWNTAIVPATHSAAPRNIPWQGHLNSHWNLSPHRADAPQTRQDGDANYRRFPLEDVQEACLMRYYVEEIGHWVSTSNPLQPPPTRFQILTNRID